MPNNVTEIVPIVFNVEKGNRCLQKYFFFQKKETWLKIQSRCIPQTVFIMK